MAEIAELRLGERSFELLFSRFSHVPSNILASTLSLLRQYCDTRHGRADLSPCQPRTPVESPIG